MPTRKQKPDQQADQILNNQGGVNAGRDVVKGDQTNYLQTTNIRGDVNTERDFVGRDSKTYNNTTVNIVLSDTTGELVYKPQLPPIPKKYILREKLYITIREHLLNQSDTEQSSFTILNGIGGVGKSILAAALCRDDAINDKYVDGIFWIDGQSDAINEQIATIGVALGGSHDYFRNPEIAFSFLKKILYEKSVLIVLDDIWKLSLLEKFQFDGSRCRILVTTRMARKFIYDIDAKVFNVDVFEKDEAIHLIESITGEKNDDYIEIVRLLRYHPLAIRLASRMIQKGTTTAQWLDKYRSRTLKLKKDLKSKETDDNLTECFDVSLREFDEKERFLYNLLGIFHEDVSLPIPVILSFWKRYSNDKDLDCFIEELVDLELLQFDKRNGTIKLHDLLSDYAKQKLEDEYGKYQREFLSIHNPNNLSWQELNLDPYFYEYLPYHLCEGGMQNEIPKILKNLIQWIDRGKTSKQILILNETLILNLWKYFWTYDREGAKYFYCKIWLKLSGTSGKFNTQIAGQLAVRSAFEVNYIDGLTIALCHHSEPIRTVAVNYVFYLINNALIDYKQTSLSILEKLINNILYLGIIPNLGVIKSVFQLCPLLLINQYQADNPDLQFAGKIVSQINKAFRLITERSILRFVGAKSRKILIIILVNIYRSLIKNAKSVTINTFEGYNNFFTTLSLDKRKLTLNFADYLDNSIGEIDDVLSVASNLIANGDRLSFLIAEFILISRGIKDPDKIASFLTKIKNKNSDEGNVVLLSVTHVLYSILSKLPKNEISNDNILILKSYVCEWMDNNSSDYGIVKYNNETFYYYPLAYYASIWTKTFPGKQVDLLTEYQSKAFKNSDYKLHNHIIASFSDFRQQYWDLPSILTIFLPYLKDVDFVDRAILVNSMGCLRGRFPVMIDDFLKDAEIAKDLYNDIYLNSFKVSLSPYIRFYQVLSDIVSFAPKSVIKTILPILKKSLNTSSFEEMGYTLIGYLINAFMEVS